MDIILVDTNLGICESWKKVFTEKNVTIINDKFENLKEYDCIVSPANSFGMMDGGIDLAIRNKFGMEIQDSVQKHIVEEFGGQQPVGTSFIVETGDKNHPYLAHTPTMRVPEPINNTTNVYFAMYALLLAVKKFGKIKKLAIPGLGTATGRLLPDQAARQMFWAYHYFNNPHKLDWRLAPSIY